MIFALVAHGSPSEVARQMDMSERHTRRLLRALQARLYARNSHHLVAQAVLTGQLTQADLLDLLPNAGLAPDGKPNERTGVSGPVRDRPDQEGHTIDT